MRVALAGTGVVAKYFAEELPAVGHEVVILTRSHKAFFDGKPGILEQRITDYSSPSKLAALLKDCDALVSAVYAYDARDPHLNLLKACKQTPKCKRFIPSEYYCDSELFPDTDIGYTEGIMDALKDQDEIEWTIVSNGSFMNYIVPKANRYHGDFGVMNFASNKMTIPGTGNERFTLTSIRDVAKAVSLLLQSSNRWNQRTYVQGEETTWLHVANTLRREGGMTDLTLSFIPTKKLEKMAQVDFAAGFMLNTVTRKSSLDQNKVQSDREQFFPDLHFTSVKELVETALKNPTSIV